MTVLSAQSIQLRMKRTPEWERFPDWALDIKPYEDANPPRQYKGMSFGLTAAGYDIRLGKLSIPDDPNRLVEALHLKTGQFVLAASLEWVKVPTDLQIIVHDKSTWARKGLALQNTVLEPGWNGHITLELSNHGNSTLYLETGMPIAQLVFHELDRPTSRPYRGKYQNQGADPVEAIYRHESVDSLMQDLNDGEGDE